VENRNEMVFWSLMLQHVGLFLAGLALIIVALWLVFSKQDAKLYEADNVVCVSQPMAVNCFDRHPK
jgi:hypothetical protein